MVLVAKQGEFGNRWAIIKPFLPGRSLVSVKNRWNWLCRRDIPSHSAEFEAIVKSQREPANDDQLGKFFENPFVIGAEAPSFDFGFWNDSEGFGSFPS
jgi:hypothetical protein